VGEVAQRVWQRKKLTRKTKADMRFAAMAADIYLYHVYLEKIVGCI
jgi:hypothetical protein